MSGFSRCCSLFLLIQILTGTCITSKFVCPGDSVQLFKMSNFDSCNAVVHLYLHGDITNQIANWTLRNCTLNSSLLPEYENKVYFNTSGTILIYNVHPWDEGRYMMRKEDTLNMTYEEQIYVMELPKNECRPTIHQLGNSLYASLNYSVCGKPPATPYWRDCCGVSYSNESVLNVSSVKEACTCYACIVSPALKCARNSMSLDYCSTFNKGGSTGITSKFVCPGDSVQLFKMSNFDSCNAVVYLYLHGDIITQIANWTLRNCTLNSSLLPEYENKVYFNTSGTILIYNVHPWDEGKYMMRKEDTLNMTYEEQIYVMELPKNECRPTICQLGNSLYASVNYSVCGKPPATHYWRDCCGVSYSNESVLKVSSEKDACTCYACIVSPALKCARNSTSLDYCSTFIKGGITSNTTPVSLETMDVKKVVGIILAISVPLVIIVIIVITILMYRRRYGISKQADQSLIQMMTVPTYGRDAKSQISQLKSTL